MQKLYCPICHKLLIKNIDLVTNETVVFDMGKIANTKNDVNIIFCRNCKRKLKYYVEGEVNG